MWQRSYTLDERTIALPRGTRVVLRVDVRGPDGFVHRAASPAVVREVTYETYALETPGGRRFAASRDQLSVPRRDVLEKLGLAQWDHRRLRDEAILLVTVGSRAWGLAGPGSDEDLRGCFVAPFEDHNSLYRVPDEIHDADNQESLWEVGKLVHQGLRGDANTLEMLWSPQIHVQTNLGRRLLESRDMFVSMNVLGSFGRYAQSQFAKIERSRARDRILSTLLEGMDAGRVTDEAAAVRFLDDRLGPKDVATWTRELRAVGRSLVDRGVLSDGTLKALVAAVADGRRAEFEPVPHRPKNAYNLLRLLHSCISWLERGEPLIEVGGDLKPVLLGIKEQRTPIEVTLRLAQEAAQRVDEAARSARLPESPDYLCADAFVRACRRDAAKKSLGISEGGLSASCPATRYDALAQRRFPVPLPPDVNVGTLARFFDRTLSNGPPVVALVLSGAHAYGFPSPDSDLDLKGVHVTTAGDLLGLSQKPTSIDMLEDFEGREHDYTTNDLGGSLQRLLSGNGNFIERFLGPFPLLQTAASDRLAELARGSLSRRCYRHYRGFMQGILREYQREKADGRKKAKRLLYVYRTGLTGLHLLSEGSVITDVTPLAERYGYAAHVAELIAVKASREGAEVDEDGAYLEDIADLEATLDASVERSMLPEDPKNSEEVEAFLVELRLLATDLRDR